MRRQNPAPLKIQVEAQIKLKLPKKSKAPELKYLTRWRQIAMPRLYL